MGRNVAIFASFFFGSIILFGIFMWMIGDETGMASLALVVFVFLSLMTTLLIRLIEIIKKNHAGHHQKKLPK